MKNNVLLKMLLFAVLMQAARIFTTGHLSFLFMFWNLFLAWLPVYFMRKSAGRNLARRVPFMLLAILFLPNAPYMCTDLFHLTKNLAAPLWFDTLLILNYAVMGLMCFSLASVQLLKELRVITGSILLYRIVKGSLLFASGYGIYLGRYLRFNSWDLLCNTAALFRSIWDSWFAPGHFKETFAISLAFSVFLYLILEIYEQHFAAKPAEQTLPG